MSETPVADLRDREARRDAVADLAVWLEDHAVAEQLAAEGLCGCHPLWSPEDAKYAHHEAVLLVMRALDAEVYDNDPLGFPS